MMQAETRKHQMRMVAEEMVLSSSYYLKAEKVDCRMTWKAQSAVHLAVQKRMENSGVAAILQERRSSTCM